MYTLPSAGGSATKDVLEATKGVDVDARKEALQIAVPGYACKFSRDDFVTHHSLRGFVRKHLSYTL